MLVRNVRLNVPSIGGDGHEPVLPVILQQIHMGEHGRGIFCAEADHIHHRRIQAVAADLIGIIGVSDADEALFQPIGKPFGIKSRDICPLPGVDDHAVLLPPGDSPCACSVRDLDLPVCSDPIPDSCCLFDLPVIIHFSGGRDKLPFRKGITSRRLRIADL